VDFSALYRTHARDVHRFALFLSGDPTLADDIVSETFIRIWNARARVDLTTVKAYLFAIARNLVLRHRKQARRNAVLDERMVDSRPGPHEQARSRDELRTVLAELQTLPEVDRSALLMRTDAAMPYQEIARALGISESAAKVKVHRARLKLAAARQKEER
jgi:RNA polymerase sigma-70 factor (ECF subfamily)